MKQSPISFMGFLNYIRTAVFHGTNKSKPRIVGTNKSRARIVGTNKSRARIVGTKKRTAPKLKRGRPPGRPKSRFNVYVGCELVEPFKKLCTEAGISASDGVSRLIENALLSRKRNKTPLKIRVNQ